MGTYRGLAPAFSIALSKWCFNILVVGLWPQRIYNFSYPQRFALLMYVFSALLAWINTLSVMKMNGFGVQITCSIFRSLFDWIAFVLVFNNRFAVQRQQLHSILFSFSTTILWDVQTRVMLGS